MHLVFTDHPAGRFRYAHPRPTPAQIEYALQVLRRVTTASLTPDGLRDYAMTQVGLTHDALVAQGKTAVWCQALEERKSC